MSQQELLEQIIRALDQAGVPHMISGSVVSSLQGEPRSTHDIDIVVSIQETAVTPLSSMFPPPHFYLDQESMREAIKNRSVFSLIDRLSGYKVDFWILTANPFDQSRFNRRYQENFFGTKMYVSSPEDTILMKLHWAEVSGGSEKQFTDALRVYEVQKEHLDTGYMEKWVKKLGLDASWRRLLREAGA